MTTAIAVFASGSGSNLQAILDAAREAGAPYRIALVVSDKPDCYAVMRANAAGVPVLAVRPKDYASKDAYEAAVVAELRARGVTWVALAGYMRLVGPTLLSAYADRIVNIHPSLLPAFPGKQAVKDALAAGARTTGVTVHFVDDGVDTGPVIRQMEVPIAPADTEESLLERIHAVEHRLYPSVLCDLVSGND